MYHLYCLIQSGLLCTIFIMLLALAVNKQTNKQREPWSTIPPTPFSNSHHELPHFYSLLTMNKLYLRVAKFHHINA